MRKDLSIFSFLLCAFAAVGLTETAEAGALRTYYKTPEGSFKSDEAIVSPRSTTTPTQSSGKDITAYCPVGQKLTGWYYYTKSPSGSDQPQGQSLGAVNPLNVKITDGNDYWLCAHFAWITYKVKYDADGGTGAPSEATGNSYNSNFAVSSTKPAKDGYTFAGWKADTSKKTYSAGDTIAGSELCRSEWHDDNQTVTLTAQWTKNQYTISTAVEPIGAGNVTGAGTYDFGTKVTLAATANSGWQFERWNDGKTDNPREVTVGADSVTYTAYFKSVIYSATIKPGEGGTGGMTVDYTLSQNSQNKGITPPTRKGYQIEAWTASGYDGTTPTISGSTLTIPARTIGNFTMTPTWKAKTYTITLNLKDGESYGDWKGPGNYQLLGALTFDAADLNQIPIAVKDDDSIFQGYFTDAGAMVYDAEGRNVKGAKGEYWTADYPNGTYCNDGDLTLSARWGEPAVKYQISVTVDPDETAGTVEGAGRYEKDSNIVLTATANTGYSFWHWTKDGAEVSTNSEYPLTVTANAEYVAVFTGNVYTVYYDAQGGEPALTEVAVSYGSPYGVQPKVVREGYLLEGWYTSTRGRGDKVGPTTLVTTMEDHDLYANWTERNPIIVFADDSYANAWVTNALTKKGDDFPAPPTNFKREGYWFNGWNPALPEKVSGDFTTYAQWLSLTDVLDCPDSGLVFTPEGKWEVRFGEPPVSAKGGSWMQLDDGSGSSHITTSISEPGTLTFHYKGNNMQVKLTGGMKYEKTLPAATSWTEFSVVIETAVTSVKVDFTCPQPDFKPASLDWVIWEPGSLPTYHKVTFKDPSGTFTNETQSVKDGEPAIVPNWETNKFESLAWDADFSKVVSDLDVNAVWTCRVEFVDLEAGNPSVTNRTEWGGSVSSPTFTPPAGKNFGGWDPAVPEAIASNMTCVAVWTAKPVYTVSYVYEQTTNKVTKTEGDTINLAGETFMRKGYTQKAWSSLEDGSSRDYEFNAPYSADADLVLYPYWEKDAVVDPIAEALDCPDSGLTFTAVGGWSVFTNAAFAKIPPSCMSNSTAGATLTTKIKGPGTLSFWWKAGSSQLQGTVKFVVKAGESTLYEDGFTGRKTTEWAEVTRRIESSGDDSELSFSCPTMNNGVFCAIDGLVWTPEGGGEPTPRDPVEVTEASVVDGVFSLTIPTESGDYGVWTNADLTIDSWGLMGEPKPGEGTPLEFKWTIIPEFPQLFFRAHKVVYE